MSVTKKIITKKISEDAALSPKDSIIFFELFLSTISKISKSKKVKISNFGTFASTYTPQRIGRNPRTKKSYIINERKKFCFKPSNKLKGELNWL